MHNMDLANRRCCTIHMKIIIYLGGRGTEDVMLTLLSGNYHGTPFAALTKTPRIMQQKNAMFFEHIWPSWRQVAVLFSTRVGIQTLPRKRKTGLLYCYCPSRWCTPSSVIVLPTSTRICSNITHAMDTANTLGGKQDAQCTDTGQRNNMKWTIHR